MIFPAKAAALAAIAASLAAASPAAAAPLTPVQRKIVAVARGQIGVREAPKGSNCTGRGVNKYFLGTRFSGSCLPWSGAFASWTLIKAGVHAPFIAYNPDFTAAYPKATVPAPGDLALTDGGSAVSIVTAVNARPGTISAVMGNYSDRVAAVTLPIAGAAFLRPSG